MIKVPPTGPKDARIVIVGEAPGEEEVSQGKPFVGRAGQLLQKLCVKAGINWSDCYVTNVFKIRPPRNEVKFFFKDSKCTILKDEFTSVPQELNDELSQLNPHVIVACGNTPLYHFTGNHNVTKYRGSIFNYNGDKLIPIIHPSAALRQFGATDQGDYKQLISLDLKKILTQSKTKGFNPKSRRFEVAKSFNDQMEVLNLLQESEFLSFDIETIGQVVACIGFAPNTSEAYCLPFTYKGNWLHPIEPRAEVKQALSSLLHNPTIKKIGQNILFDYTILGRNYRIVPVNVWRDTMIAHHFCYPEMRNGLDFLASIYTDEIYWKDDGKEWKDVRDYNKFWNYNMMDAIVTLEIAFELQKHIDKLGTNDIIKFYHDLTFGPLLKTHLQGMNYDIHEVETYKEKLINEIEETQQTLNTLAGYQVNVASPKELQQLLYNEMGYKKRFNRKTKALSTDHDSILKMGLEKPDPVLDCVLKIRKLSKLCSTYLEMPYDPTTQRIYTSYNPCGTDTGRLSSSKSVFGGGNFQNLPR